MIPAPIPVDLLNRTTMSLCWTGGHSENLLETEQPPRVNSGNKILSKETCRELRILPARCSSRSGLFVGLS